MYASLREYTSFLCRQMLQFLLLGIFLLEVIYADVMFVTPRPAMILS